jgi:hypothetical protein
MINDAPDVQREIVFVTHQCNIINDDVSEPIGKNGLIRCHPKETSKPLRFRDSFYMNYPAFIFGLKANEKRNGSNHIPSQILNVITSFSSGLVKYVGYFGSGDGVVRKSCFH